MTTDPLVPLGDGPNGTVYAGTDPDTGAAFALKVLTRPPDARTRRRAEAELAALSRLRDRAPILVADRLERRPDGRWALRMELCTQNLAELVATSGPLPAGEVVELGAALAGALAAAHGAGLVHGGVTAGNVLFRPSGEPVLSDFGPALRGAQDADERGDLRGLGAVLRLALTGGRPGPPPGTPPGLAGLIDGLADADRPELDAAAVVDRLRAGGEPGMRLPVGRPLVEFGPGDARRRRRRVVAGAVAVAAALAGVTAWAATRPDGRWPGADPLRPDSGAAQPATGPTPPPSDADPPPPGDAYRITLDAPVDRGTAVDLTWTGTAALDYAIIVTADGQPATTVLAGPATSRRVPVEPGRRYCFRIQGTDGRTVVQSNPRPVRGAAC